MNASLTSVFLILAPTLTSPYRTTNFEIDAAAPEIAKKIADAAERYRKDLAIRWLGRELPPWQVRCRIEVTVTLNSPRGLTTIDSDQGEVVSRKVEVQGTLERILKGPLPHELTHVVFAQHFAGPPPCWADEGGAVLSEDEVQGKKQRERFTRIMADQRQFPLRQLLRLRQMPSDLLCLYAQGHSVSAFLVAKKDHRTFLAFVRTGMDEGWDHAANKIYGFDSVEHMEQAWLTSLRGSDSKSSKSVSASSSAGD